MHDPVIGTRPPRVVEGVDVVVSVFWTYADTGISIPKKWVNQLMEAASQLPSTGRRTLEDVSRVRACTAGTARTSKTKTTTTTFRVRDRLMILSS
jgi:hypothetical protein